MLQSMRQLVHSWVIKALMLFLAISFSIWGIGDIFRGNPLGKTVATVGEETIDVQQLNRLFDILLGQAKQKLDPNMTPQQAKQLGLLDKALNDEIKRMQVDLDIKRLGISVTPEAVIKMLAEHPQFRTQDGKFNKQLFQQILERQRMSERTFVDQERQELAREVLLQSIKGNNTVSKTMADTLYKATAQKRILDVVTIDSSKIGGIRAPNDEALKKFYDENQPLFMAPEYRGFTVASLSIDELAKDISISDEQLLKEYEARRDQLMQPERREIMQVVTQDEEKAKHIADKASARGDMVFAAKEYGETAVPLGQMEEKNLMPDLSKPVFALRAGGVSQPVKTQLGWHVMQVKNVYPAAVPSFEKVKDTIKKDMISDQAIESATKIVNKVDDHLAAGHAFEDFADDLRLRLSRFPAVDANGNGEDGKAIEGAAYIKNAVQYAFAQNSGETSSVEDDKKGNYFAVRTDGVTPSGVRPLDSIKKEVAAAWKSHEQMLKAEEKATRIEKALREGAKLASFANEEGVSTRNSSPLSELGDADKDLPQDLMAMAFKIKKGETTAVTADNKKFVARLAKIEDADMSKDMSRRNLLSVEIKKSASNELLSQYLAYLDTLFPAKTNDTIMNKIRQQEN